MPSDAWFDRADQAFLAGRLEEHALALRAEGLPPARVALILFAFCERELRVRGRAAEIPRLLAAAPAVLETLGCPVARLERALAERRLLELIFELHDREGWPKHRILSALKSLSVLLVARHQDDEPVLVVLDRLTGFASRELQLWPDEVDD